MAVAKISLGVFLIRIVVEAWHKICIWAAIVSLVVVSILTAIMLWVQCTPTEFIWDKSLSGSCDINVTPFGVLLGGTSIRDRS